MKKYSDLRKARFTPEQLAAQEERLKAKIAEIEAAADTPRTCAQCGAACDPEDEVTHDDVTFCSDECVRRYQAN